MQLQPQYNYTFHRLFLEKYQCMPTHSTKNILIKNMEMKLGLRMNMPQRSYTVRVCQENGT